MDKGSFVEQCIDSLADQFVKEYKSSKLLKEGVEYAFELWCKLLKMDTAVSDKVWNSVVRRYLVRKKRKRK